MLLTNLLECCVQLCKEAGDEIRAVERGRETKDIGALGASLKDPEDTRSYLTIADKRAQAVIVNGLVAAFGPDLDIVGEEDMSTVDQTTAQKSTSARAYPPLSISLPESIYGAASLDDLCVFIDPVDGTREFVEGRLYACQTLIGISWRGRPVCGVVGLPFHDGAVGVFVGGAREFTLTDTQCHSQAKGHTIYGVVDVGVVGLENIGESYLRQKNKNSGSTIGPMVAVKSAVVKEAAVKAALATLATTNHADVHTHAPAEPTHFISTGGCGNKILRLLTGQADVALLNLACSMWDTCATAALLCALGGAVCTLAGYPIEHVHAPASGTYGNMHGVVAVGSGFDQRLSGLLRCTRAVWLERLRALPAVLALYRESMGEGYCEGLQSQALDLARDIDGCPFTVERLREITKDHNITGFTANECETVRYKQSHACRIRFIGGDIKSVFYKRTVLRELPYAVMKSRTVPFKITRDVQSCGVESSFLANPLVHTLEASASFSMAIPYLVQKRVFWDTPLDARFTSVLPDLSMEGGNWSQSAYLDTAQLKAALKALAEFHNFFWLNNSTPRRTGDHDSDPERNNHGATRPTQTSKHELAAQLWTTGSYWHLGRQPKGQLDKIITNWQRLYTDVFEFDKHCEDDRLSEGVAARDMETLGARLSQLAERASVATHNIDATGAEIESDADAREPYSAQTIIHGDPKAPNFFFRSRQESAKPITEANDRECGGVREGSQAGAKVHASACVGSSHSEKSAGVSDDKETSGCESDTELEVGLIDFQWAGKGLVATDVAYCIAASAHKSCFEESSLETFLAFYYACLDRDSLSYDTFRTQFDLAFIDLGRIVVADHWGAITMATLRKREGKFVFNAYNKSEAIAIWFLRELSRCLDRQLACMDS